MKRIIFLLLPLAVACSQPEQEATTVVEPVTTNEPSQADKDNWSKHKGRYKVVGRYEENIETYREQTAYLRNRIELADVTLQNLFKAHNAIIAADQQRNYLAAGIKPKE